MKRFLLVITTLFLLSTTTFAAHIIGGEMRYEYVSPGAGPNSKVYRIILILFRGDAGGAALDPSYPVAIYNNDNNLKFPGTAVNSNWSIIREKQ